MLVAWIVVETTNNETAQIQNNHSRGGGAGGHLHRHIQAVVLRLGRPDQHRSGPISEADVVGDGSGEHWGRCSSNAGEIRVGDVVVVVVVVVVVYGQTGHGSRRRKEAVDRQLPARKRDNHDAMSGGRPRRHLGHDQKPGGQVQQGLPLRLGVSQQRGVQRRVQGAGDEVHVGENAVRRHPEGALVVPLVHRPGEGQGGAAEDGGRRSHLCGLGVVQTHVQVQLGVLLQASDHDGVQVLLAGGAARGVHV